jgi:hypothetical protein
MRYSLFGEIELLSPLQREILLFSDGSSPDGTDHEMHARAECGGRTGRHHNLPPPICRRHHSHPNRLLELSTALLGVMVGVVVGSELGLRRRRGTLYERARYLCPNSGVESTNDLGPLQCWRLALKRKEKIKGVEERTIFIFGGLYRCAQEAL